MVVLLPVRRAEEAHDLTFADFEIQILDGRLPREAFGEMFDSNHSDFFSDNATGNVLESSSSTRDEGHAFQPLPTIGARDANSKVNVAAAICARE